MKSENSAKTTSIRFSAATARHIEAEIKASNETFSSFVNRAVTEKLDRANLAALIIAEAEKTRKLIETNIE